jgi:hypothetical protein
MPAESGCGCPYPDAPRSRRRDRAAAGPQAGPLGLDIATKRRCAIAVETISESTPRCERVHSAEKADERRRRP